MKLVPLIPETIRITCTNKGNSSAHFTGHDTGEDERSHKVSLIIVGKVDAFVVGRSYDVAFLIVEALGEISGEPEAGPL